MPLAGDGTTTGRWRRSIRGAFGQLYVQVLLGMAAGVLIGVLAPALGIALKPLADGFVKLIKMLLAPIIFGTVAVGIARMGTLREVGRVGLKALVYFEALSTVALLLGLIVGGAVRPGEGMNIDPARLDAGSIGSLVPSHAGQDGVASFLLGVIPDTFLGAFTGGSMLQVILIALLAGVALGGAGERSNAVTALLDEVTSMMFRIVGMVMRLAPLGAGAGIAYTIGAHGLGTVAALLKLIVALYVTTALFVTVVLGCVMRLIGLRLWPLLRYLRSELLLVFATCSTEAVLPQTIDKLEAAGVERSVVGLVLPAGYTFNTDGTSIYLAMAVTFIAQATGTPLSFGQLATLFGVLLLTSKGSAGVAGAGFVALAATLSSVPVLPVAGLVLLLGVDRFLNEARAVANLIGNCVATLAVARWDGALDLSAARRTMAGASA